MYAYVCVKSVVKKINWTGIENFNQEAGDWYLWRSSSKTYFAVISVLQGKTLQANHSKLNFSVFSWVLDRKRMKLLIILSEIGNINIQAEAAHVWINARSKNNSSPKTVLFYASRLKKHNRNSEKLF